MADPSKQSFQNRLAMFQQQKVQEKDSFQEFLKRSTQTRVPTTNPTNPELEKSLPSQSNKPPQAKPIDLSKLSQKWELRNPLEMQNQKTQQKMSTEQPQQSMLQSKIIVVESDEEEETIETHTSDQNVQSLKDDEQNQQRILKPQLGVQPSQQPISNVQIRQQVPSREPECEQNSKNNKNNSLNVPKAQGKEEQQQNTSQQLPQSDQLQQSYQLYLLQKQQNENQLRQEQFSQYLQSQMREQSNKQATNTIDSQTKQPELNPQLSHQDKFNQNYPKLSEQEKKQEIQLQQGQQQQSQSNTQEQENDEVKFKSNFIESDGDGEEEQIQPQVGQYTQQQQQEEQQQFQNTQQQQQDEVKFKSTFIESDGDGEEEQIQPQVDQQTIKQQQVEQQQFKNTQQQQQDEVKFKSTFIESDGDGEEEQIQPQLGQYTQQQQLEEQQQFQNTQQQQQDEVKFKSTFIESDGDGEEEQIQPQVDQQTIKQQQVEQQQFQNTQQQQQDEVKFKSTFIESDGDGEEEQIQPQVDQQTIKQQQVEQQQFQNTQQQQQDEVKFKSTFIESDGDGEEEQIQPQVDQQTIKQQQVEQQQFQNTQQQQQDEVKFKSTFIESDGDGEEDEQIKPQLGQYTQQQQQQEQQQFQNTHQQQQDEGRFRSTIIESDEEEENSQPEQDITQQQDSMLQTANIRCSVQQQAELYKQQQHATLHPESQGIQSSMAALKVINSEEENEIKQCETDEEAEPSSYNVMVSKVESDQGNDEEEQLDKVDEEMINSTEVNANNRLLMSCFSRNFQKSLSSQQSNNDFLHQSFRQGEQSIRSSKIIFMKDSCKPIVVSDDDYIETKLEKVLMIQNRWRAKILLRKLKKRDRYRKNVLKELISTEESYVKDLKIIIDELLKPLSKVANELEMKKIFNVESIYGLNSGLLQELLIYRKTLDEDRYQKTMGVMKDYLAYFKFYYDYCKNYTSATKLFEQYEQNNKQFSQELQRIYKSNVLRGMDVHSFLVKPVQRLPKYILLLKDLLKHTNEEHPDYQNIKKCLNDFCKINDDNNDEMQKYLNQIKLIELQNMFGNHLVIAEPTRLFIFEDTAQYYRKDQVRQIILYGFNNLLLMTFKNDQGVEKYEHHLDLTADSFIKDLEDTQFLFNLVEVITFNESITFICTSQENKKQFCSQIDKLIQELIEIKNQKEVAKMKNRNSFSNIVSEDFKPKYHIIVKVTGTESRNIQTKQYTMYIILVTIEGIEQKTFVRYSQIADLQSVVKKHDPSLKIPHFSSLKWLSNQDSKVIEERKLMIEKFLQLVLNSENILNNEEYKNTILQALQIDKNFYLLPERKQGVSRHSFSNQSLIENVLASQFSSKIRPNQLQSIILQRQATKILSLAQNNKLTMTIMDFDQANNDIKMGKAAENCPYFVDIGISDGSWKKIGFKRETRVYQIKSALATSLNLEQWIDFQLFLSDSDNQIRKIDDQECLAVILDGNQIKEKKGLGFLKNQFNKIFNQKHQIKILFRKYFYLSPTQEEKDYMQDRARLRLFTYEIIEEVFQEKYILSFSEYCVHTALYIIMVHYEKKQESEEPIRVFDPEILNKVIPQKILKTNKINLWVEQIINFIKQLQQAVIKQKQDNLKKQNQSKQPFITKLYYLTQLMIINNVKTNLMFGMSAFYVECPKEVAKNLQNNFKVKIPPNIYLGCNFCAFNILRPDNKNMIISFGYERITNLKAFPSDIQVAINDVMYQFKTPIAFEIKQQIQAYQEIITFTNELKRNT